MQDFNLLQGTVLTIEERSPRGIQRHSAERTAGPGTQDIRRPHGAQVAN